MGLQIFRLARTGLPFPKEKQGFSGENLAHLNLLKLTGSHSLNALSRNLIKPVSFKCRVESFQDPAHASSATNTGPMMIIQWFLFMCLV